VNKAEYGVVPFFNDDQPLVNTLCRIILRLAEGEPLTEGERSIVGRIARKAAEQ
jgi:hypothetical protein